MITVKAPGLFWSAYAVLLGLLLYGIGFQLWYIFHQLPLLADQQLAAQFGEWLEHLDQTVTFIGFIALIICTVLVDQLESRFALRSLLFIVLVAGAYGLFTITLMLLSSYALTPDVEKQAEASLYYYLPGHFHEIVLPIAAGTGILAMIACSRTREKAKRSDRSAGASA